MYLNRHPLKFPSLHRQRESLFDCRRRGRADSTSCPGITDRWEKLCCQGTPANCSGHLIALPSHLFLFLQQKTFSVSRHTPQNKDGVKPIFIAIFLPQTRNLMCESSAFSEDRTSSAMHLWKMEPFLLLFLGAYHSMLWPQVARTFCERSRRETNTCLWPETSYCNFTLFMKTTNIFWTY